MVVCVDNTRHFFGFGERMEEEERKQGGRKRKRKEGDGKGTKIIREASATVAF